MMRQRDAAEVREWTLDIQQLIDLMSGAQTIVAMRLHAAILALAVGRDCTVMPYDHKVRELCSEMRLAHRIESSTLASQDETARVIEQSMNLQWSRPAHLPSWDDLTITA
jgi:polysaccharide pyruvyl transferase WcaK-like protein